MECSQKLIWNKATRETLEKITVEAPDEMLQKRIRSNWDHVAKPLDGMGRFEALTAQIGAIQESEKPDVTKSAVIIMCADNGIVEEGIASPVRK